MVGFVLLSLRLLYLYGYLMLFNRLFKNLVVKDKNYLLYFMILKGYFIY